MNTKVLCACTPPHKSCCVTETKGLSGTNAGSFLPFPQLLSRCLASHSLTASPPAASTPQRCHKYIPLYVQAFDRGSPFHPILTNGWRLRVVQLSLLYRQLALLYFKVTISSHENNQYSDARGRQRGAARHVASADERSPPGRCVCVITT